MTPEQKRDFWQQHFDTWPQSGLTQRGYCDQHGLKLSTFTYWRQRLVESRTPSKLIPVDVVTSRAVVALSAGGVRLEVPASLLAEVLPVVWRCLHEAA